MKVMVGRADKDVPLTADQLEDECLYRHVHYKDSVVLALSGYLVWFVIDTTQEPFVEPISAWEGVKEAYFYRIPSSTTLTIQNHN